METERNGQEHVGVIPTWIYIVTVVALIFLSGMLVYKTAQEEEDYIMTDPVMTNLPEDIDEGIFYYYKAHINKIYDGDTASSVDIDLGFGIIMKDQHIRFYGIDTPELRGDEREEGLKVADYVKERLEGKDVILKSYKDSKGKYGRWLGEFFVDGININQELLEKGMAKPYGK